MRKLYTTIFLLISFGNFAQKSQCFCEKDSLMKENVSCDTIFFSNKSKIFWQFNCEDVWLTLENKNGEKFKINEVPIELAGYKYRLGYYLIKEYKNSLLFRSGCAANGPCSYILIDKSNGSKIKEFNQLICIDTDIQGESEKYKFDFVVYLSESSKHLFVYNIESKKTIKVAFKENLTATVPEQQFDKMILKNNVLTIFYETEDGEKSLEIHLSNKKYSR